MKKRMCTVLVLCLLLAGCAPGGEKAGETPSHAN
jgi:PBP1b-binding outer membrane lipoprotein LpoB